MYKVKFTAEHFPAFLQQFACLSMYDQNLDAACSTTHTHTHKVQCNIACLGYGQVWRAVITRMGFCVRLLHARLPQRQQSGVVLVIVQHDFWLLGPAGFCFLQLQLPEPNKRAFLQNP